MNRLWIRFALVVSILVLVPPFLLFASREFTRPVEGVPQSILEGYESLSPELRREIRRVAEGELWRGMAVWLLSGSLGSLGVGILLSRSLAAPLSELEQAAQVIETRDFSHRVPVQGSQELKAVATAFNNMADQLEQSEGLRNSLLADVAHELRTPLHLLQGNLQAILDDVYPLTKEEIAQLFDQTRHLTRLVNDLHELAQAEAQQLPLHIRMVDLAELVKETAEAIKPGAIAQGVTLQVELLGSLPSLPVDPARIRQVVHNLLSNALRHTPPEGDIWVSVEQQGQNLFIQVRDSGEGIAPENLPLVFGRFYRTDDSRSREKGGAGLGLAIVKAIVEAHGGQVVAASAGLGQGSTITVSLPIAPPPSLQVTGATSITDFECNT